jgi:site-specific DNA recombinase
MLRVRIIEDVGASEEPVTAIYIRVTKEESVKTDLSIPNQRARCLEVCSERGWMTVKLYIEPKHIGGEFGPSKRPALAALLSDLETGRVARVLARHTDRLWRGSRVQDFIMDACKRHGADIHDFGGLREQRSAGGRFALKVLGAAAELEKDLTGERIREMKRGKAKAGKVGGGPPPFGYTSQSRVKRDACARGMSEDEAERAAVERCPLPRALYVDEQEAEVVRVIFELYLKHSWGGRRIAEELNRRGHRRRGGFLWVCVKVGKVINNPVVAGFTSYDEEAYTKGLPSKRPRYRQTLYAGTHPAIITAEMWHDAQRLKTVNGQRLRTKSGTSARIYPLSGVMTCGVCGAHMRGRSGGPLNGGLYTCSKRAYLGPEHGCKGPSIRQVWAETTVWSYLDRLFHSPDLIAQIVEEASKKAKNAEPKSRTRIDALRAEAATFQAKQLKWMQSFEQDDEVGARIILTRVKELETRRLALEEEAKALEAQLPRPRERQLSPDDVLGALARLQSVSGSEPQQRRLMVERLVHRHELRVRLLDRYRIQVSLRLDPVDDETPRTAIGSRVVLTGPGKQQGVTGGQPGGIRPMHPGSPVPGWPWNSAVRPRAVAMVRFMPQVS